MKKMYWRKLYSMLLDQTFSNISGSKDLFSLKRMGVLQPISMGIENSLEKSCFCTDKECIYSKMLCPCSSPKHKCVIQNNSARRHIEKQEKGREQWYPFVLHPGTKLLSLPKHSFTVVK